jgi:hypothetical protein
MRHALLLTALLLAGCSSSKITVQELQNTLWVNRPVSRLPNAYHRFPYKVVDLPNGRRAYYFCQAEVSIDDGFQLYYVAEKKKGEWIVVDTQPVVPRKDCLGKDGKELDEITQEQWYRALR